MKEFIEKLIGRFEEVSIPIFDKDTEMESKVIFADIAKNIANELAEEYEDAEEQGLLLRLPCKVGDRFWIIAYSNNTRVVEVECIGIEITKNEKKVWIENVSNTRDFWELHFEDFDNQYFATKAEAEQALAKMKEV